MGPRIKSVYVKLHFRTYIVGTCPNHIFTFVFNFRYDHLLGQLSDPDGPMGKLFQELGITGKGKEPKEDDNYAPNDSDKCKELGKVSLPNN